MSEKQESTLGNLPKIQIDVAVIGAGSAGLPAYRNAIKHGATAVLIEGGPYGTTCARVGCMPSKLLIAAADAHHALSRLPDFGIDLPQPAQVDGVRVMERVRRERDRFVGFVVEDVDGFPEDHKIRGYAQFVDPHTLLVDLHSGDQVLVQAKSIVIATGSTPLTPANLLPAADRLLVNDDVFEWQTLPKSVLVVGTGVIGLELGQALSYLGVDVTLLGRGDRIAPISDPEVRQAAIQIFKSNMDYQSNSVIKSVQRIQGGDGPSDGVKDGEKGGVLVHYVDDQGLEQHKIVDYVLSAAGRGINTKRLALENSGLTLQVSGVPEYDSTTMQIGTSHIFIAGDVNADLPLLHEASDEGTIAGSNAARLALGQQIESGLRRTPLTIVFTEPNIATVGQMYKELAPEHNPNIAIGQVSFTNQGRSRVMLINHGMLRVYGDRVTGRFLGAEMIGPFNEHIAHLLSWAHQTQMTVAQMLTMPFYHPVIEEGLRTALRDLNAQMQG